MLGKKEGDKEFKFIGSECVELLNKRIVEEEHAARLYKSMAIWFKFKGYNGFHKYWLNWSREEKIHASWAREYLLDLSVLPETRVIKEVPFNYDSVEDVVKQTLQAEIDITKACNELALHAAEVKDHMLMNLAHKYTKEQQEEVNKITNILSQVKLYGETSLGMMELDEKMGEVE